MAQEPTYQELERQVRDLQGQFDAISKACREIEESEQLHRITLENISDTVLITEDNGHIIYVCPNTRIIFGLTQEEVYALANVQRLMNGSVCDISELKDKKEIINIEWSIVDKSGQTHFLLVTVKTVHIKGGTVLYVMRDITDRKRAEAAKVESDAKYHRLVNNLPGTAYQFTMNPRSEFRFEYMGDNCIDLLGHSAEEILADADLFFDLIPEPDADIVLGTIRKSAVSLTPYGLDHRIRKNSGDIIWLNAAATPRRLPNGDIIWDGIGTDITDRKQMEERLQKYKNIVSSTTDAIAFLDKNYRYVIVNNAYENFSGINRDKFVGRTIEEYLGHDVFEKIVKPRFDKCLQGETINYQGWFDYPTKDKLFVEITYSPFRDTDDRITGVIANTRDITARKLAQEEIEINAENMKAVFDSTPNILALINDVGRVEMINHKGASFTGKKKEDLVGLLGGEVFNCLSASKAEGCGRTPECRQCPVKTRVFATMQTGEPCIEEEGQMTFSFDGESRSLDFLISTTLLNIQGVPKTLLSLTDITERKRAEKALSESERKWRNILVNTPQLGIALDPQARIVFANQQFLKLTGYKEQDVIGQDWFDKFIPRQSSDEVRKVFQMTMNQKDPLEFSTCENEILTRTGETLNIAWYNLVNKDVSGVVSDITCLGVDLTERKKSEIEIIKQKRLFETMFNTIPDGVLITNTQREIQLANRGVESTFGYKPEELIGQSTQILYADKSKYSAAGAAAFDRDAKISGDLYVTRYRHKNGREFSGETFGAKLFDENNQWIGNLGIMRDITEREQAEMRIQQAQKIESIGNLAGGIAHDFNNILFPIVGMAELLMEEFAPGSQEYENIREIYNAGKRGSDLVKQILAFSRQSEHKKIPVRVQSVLKEAVKLCRSTIPANIEITHNLPADCGMVLADPTQIHQIAMNLITNAYHAVEPTGKSISVQLEEIAMAHNEVADSLLKPGKYAMLSVSDTGCGIDPKLFSKIFDPYFTTKEQGKGTGLGLAVVYGIVKDHHGDIKVFSEVGKGTTFNVYLPLMKRSPESAPVERAEELFAGNERILLVDDEEPIVRLEKLMIQRLGYQVTSRISSVDALAAFKANPDAFDLVITDMTMPNMTGDQLARELLSIRPGLPVIICTGFSERISQESAAASGIKGLLMKPIVKSELARMIRKVIDEAKDSMQG